MRDQDLDLLLVEIGGTHTRCAVCRAGDAPVDIALFDNAEYPDVESVVAAYLRRSTGEPPRRAALAVAAPVDERPIRLTNLGWTVDLDRLEERFGWSASVVVNDFDALACAIPALAPEELMSVRPGTAEPGAPLIVLGPGTGLGVSGLVPRGDAWYAVSGEGGHVTLAAATDREAEVLRELRREYGHVSAERVLSGPGLLALYRAVAGEPATDTPLGVSRLADSGDPHALETLELFFGFLGTIAGNLALILGARGGVYLGGGILPEIRDRLLRSGFARRFINKGRFTAYLERIPVQLILAETPALRGLSLHPDVQEMIR